MIDTFHNFVFPSFGNRWLNSLETGLLLLAIAIILFHLIHKRSEFSQEDLSSRVFTALGVLFSISFILVLFISISFIDAGTSMDERILLSVHFAMFISVFAMGALLAKTKPTSYTMPIFLLCMAFVIRFNIPEIIDRSNQMHQDGIGFNTVRWNESPTLEALNTIPMTTKIYSNGYDVIRIKTGRDVFPFPIKFNLASTLANPEYANEVTTMCSEVNQGDALIVYLDQVNWREYFADEKEMVEECDPNLLTDTHDGAIYGSMD